MDHGRGRSRVPRALRGGRRRQAHGLLRRDGERPTSAASETLDPPAPLGAEFAARYAALAAVNPPRDASLLLCSKRYNSIVLPASLVGKQGWLVYLLAASTEADLVVVGGHHRFLVSPDGAQIVEHLALSKSCLNLPQRPPSGAEAVGLFVSHVVTAAPVETHVFLSLVHRMPIFVATSRGNWMVDGAKISFMGAR